MTTFKKRLIVTMLGVIAGLAAWPIVELMLAGQAAFPSYLVFNIIFGMIFGLILGVAFGTGEGIITSHNGRIVEGVITGAIVGVAGGAIGFLTGQAALFIAGGIFFRSHQSFTMIGLPISRAIGWAFMGIIVGMTEGIRARALKKIIMGIIGGLIGGIIGGLSIEYLRIFFPNLVLARLAGLVLFGALIGFFYSIIEKQMSFGILRVLNGKAKGKEFLVNQENLRIGSDKKNDICLKDYGLAEQHAIIQVKKGDVIMKKTFAPIIVNELEVNERILKYEDVIKIGTAKLFYKHE